MGYSINPIAENCYLGTSVLINKFDIRDDTTVHQALREAQVNCLVNADYYSRQNLAIIKKRNAVTLSTPQRLPC